MGKSSTDYNDVDDDDFASLCRMVAVVVVLAGTVLWGLFRHLEDYVPTPDQVEVRGEK